MSSLLHTCTYTLTHVFLGRPFTGTMPDLVAETLLFEWKMATKS